MVAIASPPWAANSWALNSWGSMSWGVDQHVAGVPSGGLFFHNGLLLFEGGALGMSAECCCGVYPYDLTCPCLPHPAKPNALITGLPAFVDTAPSAARVDPPPNKWSWFDEEYPDGFVVEKQFAAGCTFWGPVFYNPWPASMTPGQPGSVSDGLKIEFTVTILATGIQVDMIATQTYSLAPNHASVTRWYRPFEPALTKLIDCDRTWFIPWLDGPTDTFNPEVPGESRDFPWGDADPSGITLTLTDRAPHHWNMDDNP